VTIFDRRQRLLELLRTNPGLSVPQYAVRLGVSQGTVRNDFDALAQEKLVVRVRGGAILNNTYLSKTTDANFNTFSSRLKIHQLQKDCIAREAAKLVRDGDAILLDASTTVFHMIRYLAERQHLRIVTNCLESALQLSNNPTHSVMLVGGFLRAGTVSLVGPWSEQFLDGICTRFAFVSCSGFIPESGMTEVDLFEAQFRLRAIQSAEKVIALADSSKFGKTDLTPSLHSKQIHFLFTDAGLDEKWQKRLDSNGFTYQICSIKDEK
jgi:DeoR/GlpR family transcriptional regulator of sugar metabolism